MAVKLNITDDQITQHFKLREFANWEDGAAVYDNRNSRRFYCNLQTFRSWYNRPMHITSGTRTAAFNRKVGGVSNSYHLIGLAADFRLPTDYYKMNATRKNQFIANIKNKWFDICKAEGVKGSVIIYDTIIHLSWWPQWYYEDKRGKK